ncbi:N-6 DNA methylase [Macrococcus brunensis]|nr:N-6 DNA methylase [Macrococcus brunensis]
MILENLIQYNDILEKKHAYKNNSGYEINDRTIFINHILKPLGYDETNLLQDVPQNGLVGSKSVDIRVFGNYEYKSKHSYSQFIIETKNYKSLKNLENIDYLQLKRYIKYNESKVRLIVLTDYQTLYIFNATDLKKHSQIKLNNLSSITETEKKIFNSHIFRIINLENINSNTLNELSILSYKKIFENQKFINPDDFATTNSINDPHVRKNFIFELYHLMIRLNNQLVPIFEIKLVDVHSQLGVGANKINSKSFKLLISQDTYLPIMNYLIWGIEMNYLEDFFEDSKKFDINEIEAYLNDREKKDAFVLTSLYNIINKTMFLRILEDSASKTTKFIEGKINGRYISNGILEQKRKEGKDSLIKYFFNVFNFQQHDLKSYSFILSKDIYNWVLDSEDDRISDLIIELIRLFNDINFKKINQDILGDIYEHYLEQEEDNSSKKTYRRLLGQYYTPKPIVRLMWYLTRDVLKKSYNRDLYELNKDSLVLHKNISTYGFK